MELVFHRPSRAKAKYGHLNFKIRDKKYSISIFEICKAYGIPITNETTYPYWEGIDAFWDMIVDGPFSNTSPKASKIRNPVIRYTQKLLANTIFARAENGGATRNDVLLLFRGLWEDLSKWKDYTEEDDFGRDINIAVLFLKHMEKFKKKWIRATNFPVICFGGFLTPLFKRAKVPLGEECEYREYLDIKGLLSCHFIRVNKTTKEVEYPFNHYQTGKKMFLILPNDELTNLGTLDNVIFSHTGKEEEAEASSDTRLVRIREAPSGEGTSDSTNPIPFIPKTKREKELFNALQEERRRFEERVSRDLEELKRQLIEAPRQIPQEEMASGATEGSVAQANTPIAAEALVSLANLGEQRKQFPTFTHHYTRSRKRGTTHPSSP